jgi:hypothetical protein
LDEDFSEKDLYGTWTANFYPDPKRSDTLIITENGTYQQRIHLEHYDTGPTDIETEWNRWWLEYDGPGYGYLFLEGMVGCAANPSLDCNWINDGTRMIADYCEGRWLKPSVGVTILIVEGLPEDSELISERKFLISYPLGFEASPWTYIFQSSSIE